MFITLVCANVNPYVLLVYACVYTDVSYLNIDVRLCVYQKFKNLCYLQKRCKIYSYFEHYYYMCAGIEQTV